MKGIGDRVERLLVEELHNSHSVVLLNALRTHDGPAEPFIVQAS